MTVERRGPSLGVHFQMVSVLYYRESKKMTEERQGLSRGVHFKKVPVL